MTSSVKKSGWSRWFLGGLFLLTCFALALPVLGQIGTGSIGGSVTDPTGAVIPGATVTIKNVATGATRTLTTGQAGRYEAPLLPPGNYEITIRASGFAQVVRKGIRLEVGGTVTVNIQLEPRPVGEVITVTAESALVEPRKIETSDVVTEQEVENLPINGRRWEDFVLLTPGVNTDGPFGLVSYRGLSGLYNNNMVDGGDNNQAFFSETRGRTRLQYSYSQNAIKEFRVVTSNYSAEFGRAAGGIVNAITKSGGNDWHGDIFYFIRDDAFLAQDSLSQRRGEPKPAERRQQFGGSIGGPFIQDKWFIFFNYDQQLHTFPITIVPDEPDFLNSCEPTEAAAAGAAGACTLAVFNPDPSIDAFLEQMVGVKPRDRNQNTFVIKSDWLINERNTFSFLFNFLDWRSPNGIFTGVTEDDTIEGSGLDNVKNEFLILTLTSNPTPNTVNEFRFQYGRDKEIQVPNFGPPSVSISGGLDFGQQSFLPRLPFPNEKRLQWQDNFSWVRGRHTFKTGLDINSVDDNITNLFGGGGFYLYVGGLFGRNASTNFAIDFFRALNGITPRLNYLLFDQTIDPITRDGIGNFRTTDVNWYIQDEWQVTPRLFMLFGLRYELQSMPNIRQANPIWPFTGTLNTDTNNLGPRIGLAWSPDDKTVIRSGYGIYYGRTQNSNIFIHLFQNGIFQQRFTFFLPAFFGFGPDFPNTAFPVPSGSPNLPPGPGGPISQVQPPPPGAGVSIAQALTPDFASPIVHQGEVVIERELFPNWSVSASYLLSRANQLPVFTDINLEEPTSSQTFAIFDSAGNATQVFSQPLITARLAPTAGVLMTGQSVVNSWYHAFVFQLRKRFSQGFQLNVNYTVSKTTDDGHVIGTDGTFAGTIDIPNPFDRKNESALSDLDVRNRLVVSGLWELPWKNSDTTAAKILLDGWGLSTIWRIRDGFPLTPLVNDSDDACPIGGLNGGFTCGAINSFGGATEVRLPTVGRNTFTSPGLATVALRISREIPMGESARWEFTYEVFNLFNRINVSSVENEAFNFIEPGDSLPFTGFPDCGDPGFFAGGDGCLVPRDDFLDIRGTSTRINRAREMQFGLKFIF